jgi:hypothetical protein
MRMHSSGKPHWWTVTMLYSVWLCEWVRLEHRWLIGAYSIHTSACVLYRSSGSRVLTSSGSDLPVLPDQKPESFYCRYAAWDMDRARMVDSIQFSGLWCTCVVLHHAAIAAPVHRPFRRRHTSKSYSQSRAHCESSRRRVSAIYPSRTTRYSLYVWVSISIMHNNPLLDYNGSRYFCQQPHDSALWL